MYTFRDFRGESFYYLKIGAVRRQYPLHRQEARLHQVHRPLLADILEGRQPLNGQCHPLIKAHLLKTLARKKLGFRYLMDVIPLRPDLVKGSHGRRTTDPDTGPLVISSSRQGAKERFAMTELRDLILAHLRKNS